jgi:hypothetical protein
MIGLGESTSWGISTLAIGISDPNLLESPIRRELLASKSTTSDGRFGIPLRIPASHHGLTELLILVPTSLVVLEGGPRLDSRLAIDLPLFAHWALLAKALIPSIFPHLIATSVGTLRWRWTPSLPHG